jgi:hypothetical protein
VRKHVSANLVRIEAEEEIPNDDQQKRNDDQNAKSFRMWQENYQNELQHVHESAQGALHAADHAAFSFGDVLLKQLRDCQVNHP